MLKIVIADDENIVIETLKALVPWEEFNIEIIGDASNGQEAFELCLQHRPDILLTDISMPLMDGLEVALKLKERCICTRIILLSGIEDFNYAKTALEIDVEAYILKPIRIAELKQTIKRVSENIKMEINKTELVNDLKRQLSENISMVKEKFLTNLILGINSTDKSIQDKLNFFQLSFQADENFLVCILEIDNYDSLSKIYSEEDNQLLSFSIGTVISKLLLDYQCIINLCISENRFIIIFNEDLLLNEKHIEICENLQTSIKKLLDVSVSIGIGTIVNGILNINSSYKTASTALEYKFYTGENSILNISDLDYEHDSIGFTDIFNVENEMMKYMKLGDPEEVTKIMNSIFENIKTTERQIVYVQNLCAEILHVTIRTLYEVNESINIDDIVYSHQEISQIIFSQKSIESLQTYMISVIAKIALYFSEKFSKKNSNVIIYMKNYINKNYMFDLSVLQFSEMVNLSPNYLSQVFKQDTNQTIIEYIRQVRMDTAKELLKSSDLKILQVSEMVGFQNSHYFSTVFKKYTGTYPQKYKALCNPGTEIEEL